MGIEFIHQRGSLFLEENLKSKLKLWFVLFKPVEVRKGNWKK
jgi:hypothetical protein